MAGNLGPARHVTPCRRLSGDHGVGGDGGAAAEKDDGLDAYAPPSLSGDRTGRGVACSTTPTISKVSEDAKKAKEKFPGLKTLIFVTA